ncbi:MAG: tetratricopeptide repeat protein [Terrimicrobiaceae bacterium]
MRIPLRTIVMAALAMGAVHAQEIRPEAYRAMNEGRADVAVPLFLKHLETHPEDAPAATDAAALLSGQGKHKAAGDILERAIAANPGNEGLSYRLASELAFQGKNPEARKRFLELSQSWNRDLAAMAGASLEALDRAEALEKAAKGGSISPEARRLQAEYRARAAAMERQQAVYVLIRAGKDDEAVEAVHSLARNGEATEALKLEQAYALARLGRYDEASDILRKIPESQDSSGNARFALATILLKQGRSVEAFQILRELRRSAGSTEVRDLAKAEIAGMSPAMNLDRHAWGELELYGTFLSRYDIGVAYGRLREGIFVPGARWIEPFIQADFSLDSGSKVGEGISTIYNENLAGFHAGARVRPFASQSFVLYVLGGIQKDLLGTERQKGRWFAELIAGVNGYWAWGPGKLWADLAPAAESPDAGGGLDGAVLGLSSWTMNSWTPVRMRCDWFVEAGGDAAYYTRLPDFIAYLQFRQGFRLLQFGKAAAFDAYAMENLTFDSKGNYYDNFVEAGPGVRLVTAPVKATTLSTNIEYLGGAYLGRNANNTRGSTGPTYSDFRITVSLSVRW